ncbi:MAG: dimethyl sulfoxide reductase anchor subunit [Gemmatimonadota bacterium]|jgi:Fe-S-cluster-containing dehydrogenase component/DMSO reductase anchor subunit
MSPRRLEATAPLPAFEFAPTLCTGCEACRVACGNENDGGRDTGWRQVITYNPERHPALPALHLSLACNHCEVAACANGCPARAYRRDPATGAMLIDAAKCIGCRYCSWICPYDAPRFDDDTGVMTKCTFCAHRMEDGLEPACVAACPTGALGLGERAPNVEPSFHGLGRWGLAPALTIVDAPARPIPEGLIPDDEAADDTPAFPPRRRRISLHSEKGLVAFTLILPALAAWFAGGLLVPARAPALPLFLGIAALAFAISTSHLGRSRRAWRAILGLRTSWLSREIGASGAFVLLGAATLALPGASRALGVIALAAALLAMLAMDAVYRAIPGPLRPGGQSPGATTSLLLLAGFAADLPIVAAPVALLKVTRMIVRARAGRLGMPTWTATLRAALLALALTAPLTGWPWFATFSVALLSETIDRVSFYADLEPSSPAARMEAETRAALANGRS